MNEVIVFSIVALILGALFAAISAPITFNPDEYPDEIVDD